MSSKAIRLFIKTALIAAINLALFVPAHAASFTIINGQTVTTTQTLPNANEIGVVETGGSISTTGGAAHGISVSGADVTITNSGSITTMGDSAVGIAGGTDTTITNNGLIKTAGDWASGITSSSGATIDTNGSITTTGGAAHGIYVIGTGAVITTNGSITTTGVNSIGILANGPDKIITSRGSIATTGNGASGIVAAGANATLFNSGSITTTGNNSSGIVASGADATITNSGLISANGSGEFSIEGHLTLDRNSTLNLNLLEGSRLLGAVDLGMNGTDLDIVNIIGANTSATIEFRNVEQINLLEGATGLVSGNTASQTVTVVDPTGQAANSAVLSSITSSIHGMAAQRSHIVKPLKPVQVAALKLSPGMLYQERPPETWGQVFGSHGSRDHENNVLGYDHDYAGVGVGSEYDFSGSRLGLMGGYVHSDFKTDVTSIHTETNNYFIGAYAHHKLDFINFTSSLVAGYGDHDNKRTVVDNINGIEVAQADIDSYFLSPSITAATAFELNDKMELRPSASLAYSVAWYDSYKESGTTQSDLSIDKRTVQALTGRLQLALGYLIDRSSEVELRAGATSRHTDDDDVGASLAGTHFNMAVSSDSSVYGGFIGANYRKSVIDNMNILFDVEYGRANGNERHIYGSLNFEMAF